ncbi:LysR family transcriptional regulator [Sneathiella chungangensis]|uniref:LysR family transcriptional regulator n=1 Tax=Sneathiella chungangensis TaxID=1418234 RepID=A0A845MGG8_9PROT|nr:LysR family transcriptional regulator [Sneathiella chungangensis]MZR22771.1 LysR family transcriptional regulator [Sneathiella chungangensis]
MDTELARTFLTVIATGSFIQAADRLHVTQSTVSARIHSLEEQLGCILFIRNKAGTTLTPAGAQFQKHASTLVRTVEQARQDVGIPSGFTGAITIGGRFGLWDQLLLDWLPRMQQLAPSISIRAEISFEPELMQGLIEARLDIGVMYTPHNRPGLTVEPLIEERLILVSTNPNDLPEPGPGYVYIDWGPEFYVQHSASFPEFTGAALSANVGWLGLHQILKHGGSGYFPERHVRAIIDEGRMTQIAGAPDFLLPAFIVYTSRSEKKHLATAVETIRKVASEQY